jgi:pectin methylesterase-like acyl-CoA thioesterase
MQYHQFFSCISMLLLCSGICSALECEVNDANRGVIASTIEVSQSGGGQFMTIQSAIDSIPPSNSQWTHIQISPGIYK